jgi:uncharacterized repeat protein (TIGR01451 family)
VKSFVRSVVRVVAAVVAISQLGAGVAAAQSTDLFVEKRVFGPDGPVAASAPFVYSIFVFNSGPDPVIAENVVVTDVLPAGVTFESAIVTYPEGASCAFDEPSNTVRCTLGTLLEFDAAFIDLNVIAPAVSGPIVNTVNVASTTPDPDLSSNTFSLESEVVVFNLSDLAVTTTASADAVLVHRSVTFTTTVTNNGPQDAAGVALSLVPPSNADIISVTPSPGTCGIDELGDYECLLGPLAAGATATVTMVVKPQRDGFALVFASVTGYDDPAFFDPDSLNDFDSAVVDVSYPGNADPAFTTMEHQVVPLSGSIVNPCTGEEIAVTGELRQVVSSTFSNNRFRTSTYTSFHQLSGVGETSGTEYRGHGASRTGTGLSLVKNGQFPREVTTMDTFTLIGDDGSKLLLHQNTHFSINANGTFTSSVDNPILECK